MMNKKGNRKARRNAKQQRLAMVKAMDKKQPSNDRDNKKEYHTAAIAFWDTSKANSYPNTVGGRIFLGSSSAHRQFVGNTIDNIS